MCGYRSDSGRGGGIRSWGRSSNDCGGWGYMGGLDFLQLLRGRRLWSELGLGVDWI